MDELYRTINENEFRGDGYFEATVKLRWWMPNPLLLKTYPFRWKGAFRNGDRLIIRSLGNDLYAVIGGFHDGIASESIPSYADVPLEYRIHKRYLTDIKPRQQMVAFKGLDPFITTGFRND